MKLTKLFQIGVVASLLAMTGPVSPPMQARLTCDPWPECQCECLDAWDECAEGLPIEEASKKCDPAYDQCVEENCGAS